MEETGNNGAGFPSQARGHALSLHSLVFVNLFFVSVSQEQYRQLIASLDERGAWVLVVAACILRGRATPLILSCMSVLHMILVPRHSRVTLEALPRSDAAHRGRGHARAHCTGSRSRARRCCTSCCDQRGDSCGCRCHRVSCVGRPTRPPHHPGRLGEGPRSVSTRGGGIDGTSRGQHGG